VFGYFEDGALLCPTTELVEQVNDFILSLLIGKEITYLSSDTPYQSNIRKLKVNGSRLSA